MIEEVATQKQSILLCVRCLSQKYIQHWIVTFLLCDSNDVIIGAVKASQVSVSEIRWVSEFFFLFIFLDHADNFTMYTITADYIELKA